MRIHGIDTLVDAGRIERCGAVTIAGRSLGVPSTAVAAAAIQIGQACRAVTDGTYCDFIDAGLIYCRRVRVNTAMLARAGAIPFVEANRNIGRDFLWRP